MKFPVIVLVMMILILPVVVSAQIDPNFNIYAGGGVGFPTDDLNTTWKDGFHGAISFGFLMSPGLEGALRYAYHNFPTEIDSTIVPNIADTKDDFEVQEFSFDFRANLAAPEFRFRPYGLIGVGLARTPRENKLFYCVGGGIKVLLMPKISLFLEGRYTRIPFDSFDVGYIPVTLGVAVGL